MIKSKHFLFTSTMILLLGSIYTIDCKDGQTDTGNGKCTSCLIEGCKDCKTDIAKCNSCINARFLVEDFGIMTCGYCPTGCSKCTTSTSCETCEDTYEYIEASESCQSLRGSKSITYILLAMLIPLFIVLVYLFFCCRSKAKS